MTTYNTGNPLGSSAAKDLYDNAQNLDFAVNSITQAIWLDRFGRPRQTWYGIQKYAQEAIAAFGYITIDSFEDGATLSLPNQTLRHESTGEYYRWDGEFPKVVAPGSTPETSGGVSIGAWLSVGDATLRGNLLSEDVNLGDAIITTKQIFTGAVARKLHEKIEEILSVKDAGALGNSIANDTDAFEVFEAAITGRDIDLHGGTYLVNAVPSGNRYFNGKFIVAGVIHNANYILGRNVNNVVTTLGNSGSSFPSDYLLPEINRFTYRNGSFAAGGAMNKATASGQTVAIGADAMGNTVMSFDNTAIGEVALQNVQSTVDAYSTTAVQGTRNVAIGGNTMQFLTTGWNNVAIGRNAAVCSVSVVGQVAIGNGALGGIGETGWFDYIENFCPNNSVQTYNVAIGQGTGSVYQGTQITSVGHDSGKAMRIGTGNSLFGRQSGTALESALGLNGKQLTTLNSSAAYVKTGNNMVITLAGSGAVVGGYAAILPTSGPADVTHNHVFPCLIIAVSGDTFTVHCPYSGDGSGSVTVGWTVNTTNGAVSNNNAAFGDHTIMSASSSTDTAALGNRAGQNSTTLLRAALSGTRSGQNATSITDCAFFGTDSANSATVYNRCIALGSFSLRLLIDGSVASSLTNSAAIGYGSGVSGDNQLQLGNSTQSPYAYSALQLRSDIRDKEELRGTDLGIDFINGLRPVKGKWNLRDDYYTINDDGAVSFDEEGYLAKTKMRTREHEWFIAQEVEELCKSLNVDFSGIHHAKVNGGSDVYSLGYTDFIPPLTKAVQDCWLKIQSIESRLDALEK